MNQPNQRLYFLDWIRICAFFVLILYHTGMYYVTWDWHVKSPFASHAIEPLMMLSSPWRLSLLFLVAGVASAFLMQKLATGRFLRERSKRLLLPLLFGMLVIVPPQPYYEVVEQVGYTGSYLDFMGLYVKAYHGFCDKDGCLDLPTWNHLWFVAYLWVYTMVLGLIAVVAGAERIKAASNWLARQLRGWKMIVLPALFLALVRIALRSRFPNAGGLVDDWFNHATYLPIFLAGVLLATQREFWQEAEEKRFAALGIALACWASIVVVDAMPNVSSGWTPFFRCVYTSCQWCAILAVCGFGHRHLNFDSAKRRYLTEAVFPVYILHQTLIVVFAHNMKPAGLPPVTEGLVLIVLTFCASFGIFEIVRRIPVLRPFFGLGREAQRPQLAAAPLRAAS
ncbi:acyltransferase family protein [Massilia endophytica]|uniref:acyltransferase family protein n=1 Tax=Massilia endophytica TaxID=2899220 RepID=UPI001E2B2781|nr:acyltransferase family protein [Massilia endophytica]UGQ49064.1 acyltransferase family protein [Massilia endophytica]